MNVIKVVPRMRYACGLSVGAVNGSLQRADLAGLGWRLPAGLDVDGLYERL